MSTEQKQLPKGLRTREKIYDAAISLFEEKGYQNTTIEDITERAGTAKGTFYVHFSSKKDLVYHTLERYDEIASLTYEEVSSLKTFKEQLVAYMQHSNHAIKSLGHEVLKALYLNDIAEDSSVVTKPEREIYNSIKKIVEFGIHSGELSDKHSIDYYVQLIVFGILGIDFFWCSTPSDSVDIEGSAGVMAQVLCDGLLRM